MADPKTVAEAEADLAAAEAELAEAEKAGQPEKQGSQLGGPVAEQPNAQTGEPEPSLMEKVADVVAPVKEGDPAPQESAAHDDAPPAEPGTVVTQPGATEPPVQPVVEQPTVHPDQEKSTEELLAAAPPLQMPPGQRIEKVCPGCGLKLDNPPAGLTCPNCGTTVP